MISSIHHPLSLIQTFPDEVLFLIISFLTSYPNFILPPFSKLLDYDTLMEYKSDLSRNTGAFYFLKRHPELIDWNSIQSNEDPLIFNYFVASLDYNQLDWFHLCRNKNPLAIEMIKRHYESNMENMGTVDEYIQEEITEVYNYQLKKNLLLSSPPSSINDILQQLRFFDVSCLCEETDKELVEIVQNNYRFLMDKYPAYASIYENPMMEKIILNEDTFSTHAHVSMVHCTFGGLLENPNPKIFQRGIDYNKDTFINNENAKYFFGWYLMASNACAIDLLKTKVENEKFLTLEDFIDHMGNNNNSKKDFAHFKSCFLGNLLMNPKIFCDPNTMYEENLKANFNYMTKYVLCIRTRK